LKRFSPRFHGLAYSRIPRDNDEQPSCRSPVAGRSHSPYGRCTEGISLR
jgi:hypothetical protein